MVAWEVEKLDSWVTSGAIELGRGDIISKDDINAFPGPYPIYSSSAHNNGKFGEYAKYMFDEELITWSVDGGGNLFYRPKHKFSVTNVCGYMRVKTNGLHAPFIYYCLANQHDFLTFDYTTKAHPSVIRKLYWLPKLDFGAQRKIAHILQTIDKTIEKTESLIEKYQQIKAGLMHDLFTRGIGADGKLRPPREQAPELYQQTPIGWIPKEWGMTRLDAVAEIIDPQPDHRTPPEHLEGMPYIGIGDFNQFGAVDFSKCRKVIHKAFKNQRLRFTAKQGDIIYGKIGTIGKPKTLSDGDYALSANVVLIQPKVTPSYIRHTLDSWMFMKQVSDITNTTSQPALGIEKIRIIKIPMPAVEQEIEGIAQRLDVFDGKLHTEARNREKLMKLKCGLMHDLLTGKVQVNPDLPEATHVQ